MISEFRPWSQNASVQNLALQFTNHVNLERYVNRLYHSLPNCKMRIAIQFNLQRFDKIKGVTVCKAVRNGLVHSWPSINSIPYYQLNVSHIIIFSLHGYGYGYGHESPVSVTGHTETVLGNSTLFNECFQSLGKQGQGMFALQSV